MAADEAREAVEALELSVAIDDLCDTAVEALPDLVETRPGMMAAWVDESNGDYRGFGNASVGDVDE